MGAGLLLAVRRGECRIAADSAARWVQDCCWRCDKVSTGLLLTVRQGACRIAAKREQR